MRHGHLDFSRLKNAFLHHLVFLFTRIYGNPALVLLAQLALQLEQPGPRDDWVILGSLRPWYKRLWPLRCSPNYGRLVVAVAPCSHWT